MMTNETPLDNLLTLIRTESPDVTLRSAAEIKALGDRVRPVVADLSQAEIAPEVQERLRGLSMGDSPALLDELATALPDLPDLATVLANTPDGLRNLAALLLELGALERAFLLLYDGADNAVLSGLATGQEQVQATLSAADARALDTKLPAETRRALVSRAQEVAASFIAAAPAAAPAAERSALDDSQAVATFVGAVREGGVAALPAGAKAESGDKNTTKRAPRKTAR